MQMTVVLGTVGSMARNRRRQGQQQQRRQPVPLPAEGDTPLTLPSQPQPDNAQQGTVEEALALLDTHVLPKLKAVQDAVGYPIVSYFIETAAMADEQMLHIYEHLRRLGRQEKIGLWINSRGGATEVPWKIVSLFREYAQTFAVLVPYRAHSSATLVCMGADELVLTPMSELGPIDPSRRHPLLPAEETPSGTKTPMTISVQDLRHVLEFLQRQIGTDLPPEVAAQVYTALFEHVHPLAIGALEQSWALAQQIGTQILSTHIDDDDEIKKIVNQLADYYKSHLYQITRAEAREIGLKVKDATEEEGAAMWELYLAYAGVQFAGEAKGQGGEQIVLTGIGHIDSEAGSTIGLGIALKSNPAEAVAARWQSNWRDSPEAQQNDAPAAPTPSP